MYSKNAKNGNNFRNVVHAIGNGIIGNNSHSDNNNGNTDKQYSSNDANELLGINDFDISKLLQATESESNDNLIHLTTLKIQELNLSILQELKLKKKDTLAILKKLNGYKYVDELKEMKHGRFIRWVPLKDPDNLYLIKGGIICDVKAKDDGMYIVCKNFMHRHFQFKMDECLIFQKLTSQEQVLLTALDHLEEDS